MIHLILTTSKYRAKKLAKEFYALTEDWDWARPEDFNTLPPDLYAVHLDPALPAGQRKHIIESVRGQSHGVS